MTIGPMNGCGRQHPVQSQQRNLVLQGVRVEAFYLVVEFSAKSCRIG